jgi:hypothetical protein
MRKMVRGPGEFEPYRPRKKRVGLTGTEARLIEVARRLPPGDIQRLIETAASWVKTTQAAKEAEQR